MITDKDRENARDVWERIDRYGQSLLGEGPFSFFKIVRETEPTKTWLEKEKDFAIRYITTKLAESAEQARKEAAENGIIFMQERLIPGVFTDIMLDEMRAVILNSPVKEGKTDAEKLAIAVKALEYASISLAQYDGDYGTLSLVRQALKEIQ